MIEVGFAVQRVNHSVQVAFLDVLDSIVIYISFQRIIGLSTIDLLQVARDVLGFRLNYVENGRHLDNLLIRT